MAEADGNDRLYELIVSVKESLEKEIHSFRDEMTARFDTQAARLDRQGGIMRPANVWLSRMTDWSEKIDSQLEAKDKQIADLTRRIERLEKGSGANPNVQ